MHNPPKRSQILIALMAVYIIWGSTYFAIKLALPDYPPFLLAGIRLAIAFCSVVTALNELVPR